LTKARQPHAVREAAQRVVAHIRAGGGHFGRLRKKSAILDAW